MTMNLSESTKTFHERQVGTTERSSAARMDRTTEDKLYRLYRTFFEEAEDNRNWNLWKDIPWNDVKRSPAPELVSALMTAYKEALFLPDYSSYTLKALRASRGRAWFLTRWSYEEGKHLLAMGDWFVKTHTLADKDLKALSNELLAHYHWEPPFDDAPGLFLDALLYERREIEQMTAIQRLAASSGDTALTLLMDKILEDEAAHQAFFRQALTIIGETYPELVRDAIARITEGDRNAQEELLRLVNISA
jgi:acyl-[acyl-carrier-protein] desaturase